MSLYLRNATWIDPETFKATTTTIKVEEGPSGGMALDAHAPVECPPEDTVLHGPPRHALLRLRAPPYLLGPRTRYASRTQGAGELP